MIGIYTKREHGFRYALFFAVWTGLEPATPCVTGRYSNQLNYHTVLADLRCKDSISFPSLQIIPIFTSRSHEKTIVQGYLFTAYTFLISVFSA